MNSLYCLIILIGYYGVCIAAVAFAGGYNDVRCLYHHFSFSSKVVLRAILLASLILIAYWVKQDCFIYYWDYSAYWTMAIDRMNYMFSNSFLDIIKSLANSINSDDYNVLLPTLTALPMKFLGFSYPRYVFINCVMFLLPSVLVQGMIGVKLLKNTSIRKDRVYVLTVLFALCLPNNYYSALKGYIDIGYLLPMSIAMYHLVDYDFMKVSFSKNVVISIMLILAWLSRRYAVYFIFGYICAFAVLAFRAYLVEEGPDKLKKIIVNFLTIGMISLAILFLFCRGFLRKAIFSNYGVMYSAYNAPLAYKFELLNDSFGWVTFILVGISGVLCFVQRKNRCMYFALLIMAAVETAMFWQTQVMGIHHKMILNLPVLMLIVLTADCWGRNTTEKERGRKRRIRGTNIMALLSVILMMSNFAKALIPAVSAEGTGKWFAVRHSPLKRGDIEAISKLTSWLNHETENTEDYIYVAASGGVLNCDILRKSKMPETNNAIPHMYTTHDVDLRDGFPEDFLRAKYIVTTSPIELHLSSGQEVVRYIAAEVQDTDSHIGRHFEFRYEIELDNGVIAYVYSKLSDFTLDDLQEMRNHFSQLYPEAAELFADRIR